MEKPSGQISFFKRLRMAWACLFRREFAKKVAPAYAALLGPKREEPTEPPERIHASGLAMLGMLQREGRLIDFLQEDVASFPDADIGAAARVVHAGCRKVLKQCLALEPVLPEAEGDKVSVPEGFDAQRIRLTGNVTGKPPFSGTLKHHGWYTTAVRFPDVSAALDPRVLAAAEVEL